MSRVRTSARAVSIAAAALLLAPGTATARRGPGGDIGLGLTVGAPSGVEASFHVAPWLSLDATLGLPRFEERSYAGLALGLHTAELVRTPMLSLRAELGVGGYAAWKSPFASRHGDEAGVLATPSLLVEPSFAPFQLFVRAPLTLALTRFERPLGDRRVQVGFTGGILYYF